MSHNILVTGASGYLGGTFLARWSSANLPAYHKLYALVRKEEQKEAVKAYGAEPLIFNIKDDASTRTAIIENKITIVYYLIDASAADTQVKIIEALAEVKKQTGQDVHFLQTSGAKLFSSHAGIQTDPPVADNDSGLYDRQKRSQARWEPVGKAVNTNNAIIEAAVRYGVKSYIFIPCLVYGKGEGFGNQTSIQTVAIVNCAKKLGQVYRPDAENYVSSMLLVPLIQLLIFLKSWPVCHVVDNAKLYLEIVRNILSGNEIGSGKNGYYLAGSGTVAWNDIYTAMARGLAARKIVDSAKVELVDDHALEGMATVLKCPKEMVSLFLGGNCTLQAKHGPEIGWKPEYLPQKAVEMAEAEVDLILQNS